MELKPLERLMLINQYKILEALYDDEADYYSRQREALERGYELHYKEVLDGLEQEYLSASECSEVIDILDMHQQLVYAYNNLDDKEGIREHSITFSGFDGNDTEECKRIGYARYFIVTLDRFEALQTGDTSYNSHCIMMPQYRRMLGVWKSCQSKYNLTKTDILNIINA